MSHQAERTYQIGEALLRKAQPLPDQATTTTAIAPWRAAPATKLALNFVSEQS